MNANVSWRGLLIFVAVFLATTYVVERWERAKPAEPTKHYICVDPKRPVRA